MISSYQKQCKLANQLTKIILCKHRFLCKCFSWSIARQSRTMRCTVAEGGFIWFKGLLLFCQKGTMWRHVDGDRHSLDKAFNYGYAQNLSRGGLLLHYYYINTIILCYLIIVLCYNDVIVTNIIYCPFPTHMGVNEIIVSVPWA